MEEFINLFISPVYAENAVPPGSQGGGLSFVVMLVVFVVFLYFSIWRPQSRRAKEQRALLGSLAKGDEVMTAGGLLGKITKVSEQYIGMSIANNVEITVQKSSVVTILPKGTMKSLE